mgnify:CR=1 FL=1
MTTRKPIHTDKAPKAIGPYSQALRIGDTLYISGQVGIDPASSQLVQGDTAAQARQALTNIGAILAEAGFTMKEVAQVQIFLTDMGDFVPVNEVYKTFFEEPYPARAAVQVGALPAAAAVEIMAVAHKQGKPATAQPHSVAHKIMKHKHEDDLP